MMHQPESKGNPERVDERGRGRGAQWSTCGAGGEL